MKYALLTIAIVLPIFGCQKDPVLINETRPGGYAMGEKVPLKFSLSKIDNPPDSIDVSVWEKKTDYRYAFRAALENCDIVCGYSRIWVGRKPDGRWPAGGTYLVFASVEMKRTVYSDTVVIGLAD
ncbi:MAG: hypothetical protein V3W18_13020 [candidate division Zixibacteria bacterium]